MITVNIQYGTYMAHFGFLGLSSYFCDCIVILSVRKVPSQVSGLHNLQVKI